MAQVLYGPDNLMATQTEKCKNTQETPDGCSILPLCWLSQAIYVHVILHVLSYRDNQLQQLAITANQINKFTE